MPRYFIAPRLATAAESTRSPEAHTAFFAGFAASENIAALKSSGPRDTVAVELNADEAAAKQAQMSSDVIVEKEKLRWHGLLHPLAQQAVSNTQLPPGIGATVELQVTLNGQPLESVVAAMSLMALRGGLGTTSTAATGPDGKAAVLYDPRVWLPFMLTVTPRSRAWAGYAQVTSSRMTVALQALPRSGPLGWWHNSLGLSRYSQELGSGIRVGIIDTGIGPHPYLAHAKRAGAIIAGEPNQAENATDDVAEHGTHVAGIIGARPTDAKDYAGIAPGADLVALRVYPGDGPLGDESGYASNGDISQAITRLSQDEECDIINLSSGGLLRSEIEVDRIIAAFNRGTLMVCSAGNGSGPPVLFPAADPSVVGVSAMGIPNATPRSALDIFSMPMISDRYTMAGTYLAAFSSFGPEIKCIAPGVGIISTVPTSGNSPPAYLAASGTSMSAPVVTGTLAALLSRDATYKSLPRTRERALWAWSVLARTLRSLGLFFPYQGFGLPTILS
jgi:subtilisin family serine protease